MTEIILGVLIIFAALSSPVWVVLGVIKFIQWQEFKKRTYGGVQVSQEFLDRLNGKTIKQVSPDGSRELTLGYQKEGF